MEQRSFFLLSDRGNGELDLFWLRNDGPALIPRAFPRPLPFADPTTEEDRAELRWYQEQALSRPLPAERERARRVEERMQTLGSRLFQQVFRVHEEQPDPRSFYREAVADGLEGCELRIVSDAPSFLSIPWELLYESPQGFLVQSLAGLYRQPLEQAPAPAPIDPAGPLRVLLVTPRPEGPDHAPARTVARALPRAVRELWPRVQIDLLRPPTLAALRQQLAQQPGGYQVVHFDGHVAASRRRVAEHVEAEAPGAPSGTVTTTVHESWLLLEGLEGRPEPVPAERLASALMERTVPLVVVSACAAADDDERPHTILAAQLIQAGVPGAIVLPYALDAGAAERLLRPLYNHLVGGASLAEAVTEGRRALAAERRRSSAIGPLTLEDWGVPMLYQHSPDLQLVRPAAESTPAPVVPDEVARTRQHVAEVCRPGRLGLLGREADLLRIDRALGERQQPWALLTGPAGIGKSALALDFGRWYYETGGCPGGVFVSAFRSRADFGQVLGSVVSRREEFFGRYSPAERSQRLVEHLRITPCLLILDDFETVAGHGTGTAPLANERDRRDLGDFLFALRGGRSRVLITSRNPDEGWLGIRPVEVRLGGLTGRPADILAAVILRGVGRDAADFQRDRDYGRLLELLEGHPRALEVVMPQLRALSPAQLVDAFRNLDASAAGPLETFQSFALEQLSATARRHLPATALFNGVINADLGAMLFPPGGPQADGYAAIVGEAPDRAGWRAILAEAAGAGLVRDLGRARYQIPATLLPLLRRRLIARVGQDGVRALDRELTSFYAALTGKLAEGVHRGDASAVSLLTSEGPNLVRVLRAADHGGDWPTTFSIVRVLADLYEAQGRHDEWARLRDHLLERLGGVPPADEIRGDLWRFLTTNQAREALRRRDFPMARAIDLRLLEHFQAWDHPRAEPAIAGIKGQLGLVAEEEREPAEAETWYRQALEIRERRGQQREAAGLMQQLGGLAQAGQRFDEAEAWYAGALERYERLALEREMASTMQRLGQMALSRRRPAEADTWLQRAVEIAERLEQHRDAATTMQGLGVAAQQRNRPDEAERWYAGALERYERLGLETDAAASLHALGSVVLAGQRFDQAEGHLLRALALAERHALWPLQVDVLLALAQVQQARRDLTETVRRLGMALHVVADHQPARRQEVLGQLARIASPIGNDRLRRLWQALFPGENAPLDEIAQAAQTS